MHAVMNARSIKWDIVRNVRKLAGAARMSVAAWPAAHAVRRPEREQGQQLIKESLSGFH